MEKIKLIETIKMLYDKGGNIIQYLKDKDGRNYNTIEDILISYDFQAGSYITEFYNNRETKEMYCSAIAGVINSLGKFDSVMEAGVGEATTLAPVLSNLRSRPAIALGFDLSWSRVHFARNFLRDFGYSETRLFTGNLFEIPLPSNSVDVVYTSHSLEPNGGREREALAELYRIAKRYIVLLEPSYELASAEARARMKKHGYITNLLEATKQLGYKILEHRLFEVSSSPLNPTGLLVLEKKNGSSVNDPNFVCPISKSMLTNFENHVLFSNESLLAYPIVKGIPCLLHQNALLATHFALDYQTFKKNTGIR
jgi:ubiquinone/menaquinone biosynthesis C-methylase UbiE/uncharacterized protein YbaR (Trm112 family)